MKNYKLNLSEDELITARKLATSFQIQKQYYQKEAQYDSVKKYHKYFYSEPSEILYLDKYIQLLTLEECFDELPSMVKIRKRKGQKYFKITGNQSEMDIYDPLVLVDRIAVKDIDNLLKISPAGIDRIEVINVPYIKGDMIYGGIISIISKKGDFARIDLPVNGMFINYEFLTRNNDCSYNESNLLNIPDVRNTLFWEPDYLANSDESGHVEFMTSDSPGKYEIIVRAIDNNRNILIYKNSFTVIGK